MDVSQEEMLSGTEGSVVEGDDLVRSIIALTGLPDGSVRTELKEILSLGAAENPESIPDLSKMSLEDLRAAMLVYLESIHADMVASGEADGSVEVPEI